MRNTTLRIRDLRKPILTDAAIQWINDVNAMGGPAEFDADTVLQTAQERTGLTDFGPGDPTERLQQLIPSTDTGVFCDDSNFTITLRAQRHRLFRSLVHLASVRLRLYELLHRHPEIQGIQIRKPIIITGLPRSGTTHLQGLIASDSRLHFLPMWESFNPIPPISNETLDTKADFRVERYANKYELFKKMLPYSDLMDPRGPHDAAEEDSLQESNFHSPWDAPRVSEKLCGGDDGYKAHYEYMKTILKVLQWRRGPGRWVLKSLTHIEHISTLLETFPDATIVLTHRDPVAVIQSEATKDSYQSRLFLREVDTNAIFSMWTTQVEGMLRSLLKDIHRIPQDNVIEVPFLQYKSEPMNIAKNIYSKAKINITDESHSDMTKFLSDQRRVERVRYDMREDFGVEPNDLRARFLFYLNEFPLQAEVH